MAANAPTQITSLNLTAGIWLVCGQGIDSALLGTSTTAFTVWSGTVSASFTGQFPGGLSSIGATLNGSVTGLQAGCVYQNISASTTFYLNAQLTGSGTAGAAVGYFYGVRIH
jgi:hypothetical protein